MLVQALVASLLLTQVGLERTGQEGKLGLTDRQILALGQEAFVNKFTDKFGGSTMAMVDGFEIYGQAVKSMNDQVFLKSSASRLKTIGSLRTRMTRFRTEMCDIGRTVTGGGTLWNITYSETRADVEETLAIFSGVLQVQPRNRVVSDVTKALDRIGVLAKEHEEGIELVKESGGGIHEVNTSLKLARTEYAELVKLAAKLPRRESDAVLGFCLDAAQIAIDQFGS